MTNITILEDAVLHRLLRDSRFTDEFSFLKNAGEQVRSMEQDPSYKKCCAAKKRSLVNVKYDELKTAIAGLPAERRTVFKRLLDTRQVRVIYRTPTGKRIRLTF